MDTGESTKLFVRWNVLLYMHFQVDFRSEGVTNTHLIIYSQEIQLIWINPHTYI